MNAQVLALPAVRAIFRHVFQVPGYWPINLVEANLYWGVIANWQSYNEDGALDLIRCRHLRGATCQASRELGVVCPCFHCHALYVLEGQELLAYAAAYEEDWTSDSSADGSASEGEVASSSGESGVESELEGYQHYYDHLV
jgi:hypothetical protein